MTRDEAKTIWETVLEERGNFIDVFVALGMLKLDEPKTVSQNYLWGFAGRGKLDEQKDPMAKTFDALSALYSGDAISRILRILHANKLKIVEDK
jgi:hypothetical protein